jgi:hypothetical protein
VRCWSCSEPFKPADTGSIPVRVTLARCDVGAYSQALNLADAGSIPVRVTEYETKWWNLVDTRHSECRALEAWEFDSPLRHFFAGAAGAQLGFISPTCPVRYRDLQPCGWASAQWSFMCSAGRVRPPDPPLG